MPSKTSVNPEIQSAAVGSSSNSGRNSVTDSNADAPALPQQVLGIVHHKWRNLEKRKKKLDDYKKIGQANLKPDQREALTHFDEVVLLLDLLGDMKKQFESAFAEHETMLKRQTKMEKNAQRKRDIERTREMLEIRTVLNYLRDESIRSELKKSKVVSEVELNALDKFYQTVEPTNATCGEGNMDSFLSSATDCFERLLRREDKQFHENLSYSQLRILFSRIHEVLSERGTPNNVEKESEKVTKAEVADAVPHKTTHASEENVVNKPNNAPEQPVTKNGKEAEKQQGGHQKLEEIVKPGSFSFLQESQISSNNMQSRGGAAPREFTNSNAQGQPGAKVSFIVAQFFLCTFRYLFPRLCPNKPMKNVLNNMAIVAIMNVVVTDNKEIGNNTHPRVAQMRTTKL